MNAKPLATAIAALLLLAVRPCHAAYISEVFFDDGSGAEGMPTAVEVRGLDSGATDYMDLIVIDAGVGRYGTVQRVVSLPTTNPLALVSEHAWPTTLWGRSLSPDATSNMILGDISDDTDFGFRFVRSLLLYDRQTRVVKGGANLFSDEQQQRLDGAVLLDAITFTFDGLDAAAEAPNPRYDVGEGYAIVRPMEYDSDLGTPVAGLVNKQGNLEGLSPDLAVTPGWGNPAWEPASPLLSPAPAPEPSTAWLVLPVLLVFLACRPPHRRHCSSWPSRL